MADKRYTDEELMELFGELLLDGTSKLALRWHQTEQKIRAKELEIRKPMDDATFRAEIGAHREHVYKAIQGDTFSWVKTWFPRVVLNDFGQGSAWAKKYGSDADWVNLFVHIANPSWRDWTGWLNTLARFLGEEGATSVTRLYAEKLYGQAADEFKRRFGDGEVKEPELGDDSTSPDETFTQFHKRRKIFWDNLESNPDYFLMESVREALENVNDRLYGSEQRGSGKGGGDKGNEPPKEPTLEEQIEEKQREHEEAGNRLAELIQLAKSATSPAVMKGHLGAAEGVEAEVNRLQRELDELKLKQQTGQRVETAASIELARETTEGGKPLTTVGAAVAINGQQVQSKDDLAQWTVLINEAITARPTAEQYLVEIRDLERQLKDQFDAVTRFATEATDLQVQITKATAAGEFGNIGQLGGQLTQRMTSLGTATAQVETITKRLSELQSLVEAEPEKQEKDDDGDTKVPTRPEFMAMVKASDLSPEDKKALNLLAIKGQIAEAFTKFTELTKPVEEEMVEVEPLSPFAQFVLQVNEVELDEELKAALIEQAESNLEGAQEALADLLS